MPTILTHPAVALTARWLPRLPRGAVLFGVIGSILPDADVAAFAFGIPYGHTFGHRGFTHSIAFAVLYASVATLILRGRFPAFAFLFLCTMSHAALDALTDGGLGVAFFSPFSNERYFFPWQPIRVSPIGPGFFSARGWETLKSELVWVWLPSVVVWSAATAWRARTSKSADSPSPHSTGSLGEDGVHVEGEPGQER